VRPASCFSKPAAAHAFPFSPVHALLKPTGHPPELFCLDVDLSETKRAQEQVRQLAFFDPLTGLPNRRLLVDRLSQTLAASKRNSIFGALMFLDLDNFKPLNDAHGHGVGDLLLSEVARRLSGCVREMDTVSAIQFIAMKTELTTHDTTRIDDTRIGAVRPLITPALLEEKLPVPDAAQALVETSRTAISACCTGRTTG
jgi:GGDEF domain-containing protein